MVQCHAHFELYYGNVFKIGIDSLGICLSLLCIEIQNQSCHCKVTDRKEFLSQRSCMVEQKGLSDRAKI